MTDQPGAAGAKPDVADTPQWRIDGSASYIHDGAPGLDDTVVRLPPIQEPTGSVPASSGPVNPAPAYTSPPANPAPAYTVPPVVNPWSPVSSEATQHLPDAGVTTQPMPYAGATTVAPPVSTPAPAPAGGAAAGAGAAGAAPGTAAAGVAGAAAAGGATKAATDVRRSGTRRTRKARLRLSRIDPWSVMKTSFLFSIAFGIMFWVATYVVWSVIGASGVFEAVNEAIVNILSSPNDATPWRIEDYVNTNKVLGIAALIAVVNVVLMTALGTLTAFLYNLSANILGGLELTLAED